MMDTNNLGSGHSHLGEMEQVTFSPKISATQHPISTGSMSERIKLLTASFAKPPELTLEESTQIQECFTALLGERESITNSFELRVLLGEVGLYPSEEELEMVLQAFRSKVNLSSLYKYLRFYKKEHMINAAAYAAEESAAAATAAAAALAPAASSSTEMKLAHGDGDAAAASHDVNFQAFCGNKNLGDADTLRAFVALGGNEDSTGEINARVLSNLVRQFGLTIDMDGMIAAVDVHSSGVLDYADFCTLWSLSGGNIHRRGSGCSFSTLNVASPRNVSTAGMYSQSNSISGMTPETRKHVLAVLQGAGDHRVSTQAGGNGRKPPRQPFSPRKYLTNVVPVSGQESGAHIFAVPSRQAECVAADSLSTPLTQGPLTDEEHLLLLQYYLFPERLEASRRARIADVKQDGNGLSSRRGSTSPRKGRSPRHSRVFGANAARRSISASRTARSRSTKNRSGSGRRKLGNARKRDDDSDDDDFLSKGNGAYRPPSPMILSLRNNPAYMNSQQRQAKTKPVLHCPYHGKGIQYAATSGALTIGSNGNGGASGENYRN